MVSTECKSVLYKLSGRDDTFLPKRCSGAKIFTGMPFWCIPARLHLFHTHTHTHSFNGTFSGTTQVSRYQKGKTNLDFTGARDSEWQWHQLGYM